MFAGGSASSLEQRQDVVVRRGARAIVAVAARAARRRRVQVRRVQVRQQLHRVHAVW